MQYNLGEYRSDNGKIYKQRKWWPFYKCIDKGPYNYMEGIKIVNDLCGCKEEPEDLENSDKDLEVWESDATTIGNFLVSLKVPYPGHGNDAMIAYVEPYGDKKRLLVTWENGYDCIGTPENFNIYEEP